MVRGGERIIVEEQEAATTVPRRRFRGQRSPRSLGASVTPKNKKQQCADLEGEVSRQDVEIAALRSGRLADQESLNRARDELEEMRRIYQADMRMHSERSDTLRMENAGLKTEIEVLTREFNAEAVIARYADIIKSKGSTPASEYASRLQSELCKAAHRVEVLNDQVKVVKRTCDEKVKNLEEELSQLAHEKGQREANLMKERRALHYAKRVGMSSY
uniref:Uncharacterized protein n=1 Tax=Odontella aurita TaxID=265563 RepID=A0A7S4I5C4_9STRA